MAQITSLPQQGSQEHTEPGLREASTSLRGHEASTSLRGHDCMGMMPCGAGTDTARTTECHACAGLPKSSSSPHQMPHWIACLHLQSLPYTFHEDVHKNSDLQELAHEREAVAKEASMRRFTPARCPLLPRTLASVRAHLRMAPPPIGFSCCSSCDHDAIVSPSSNQLLVSFIVTPLSPPPPTLFIV